MVYAGKYIPSSLTTVNHNFLENVPAAFEQTIAEYTEEESRKSTAVVTMVALEMM